MNKISENGRSMIEMLGVLAIIGVLSVGGIMGYSKAMFRYKINKTIEQITYIAGNVRTTFANQGNYAGVDNTTIWKKASIFPEDMWNEGDDYPQNVWEDYVYLGEETKNSADTDGNKAFYINYSKIPEEACIELITQDWSNAQVMLIEVYDNEEYGGSSDEYYIITPVAINDAVAICQSTSKMLDIIFRFDIDTSDNVWKSLIDDTMDELHGS